MASFYAWETVDFILSLSREDGQAVLADARDVIVSIDQLGVLLEKDLANLGIDTAADEITIHLSQEETGGFKPGTATIQVNILYEDSERDTSVQAEISVLANLHKAVMT